MNKVLLLGAGMVAKPVAGYILKNNFQLTVASRTLQKAEKLISGHTNGKAVFWTADDLKTLEDLIKSHDLVISLLPFSFQPLIAGYCVKHAKNMVSTAYVTPEMKALDDDARKAGIIILNEMGFAPGFDHMTAMQIVDSVKAEGGKIREFYSYCGALAAPEETDNPFRFKFSWSPRDVLMAGNYYAKYLKNTNVIEIPSENLFKNPVKTDCGEIGTLEIYPNRDSIAYMEKYNIPGVETLFRGTLRYPDWCESMDAIKTLGLLSTEKQNFEGKTFKEIVAEKLDVYPKNVKEKTAGRLRLNLHSPAIEALDWLGYFSNEKVNVRESSTFDITACLMTKKMLLPEGARDMVILQHEFTIENAKGEKEIIKSGFVDFPVNGSTSIARTVALPAAIAARQILEGKISEKGVQIPVSKSIYEPVLKELEFQGIFMNEERGVTD